MLIVLSLIVVVALMPFAFADSGIRHVKCIDLQKSILNVEYFEVSEFDYFAVLTIEQNDGKCIMKNKLGRPYLVDWMPAYHIVKLNDMDFGEISRQRIMIPDETEQIDFKLQKEIPYCVKVTSVWLDNRVRVESTSEVCLEKL